MNKRKVDSSLPFNKYLEKNPEKIEVIAAKTGLSYAQVCHMKQGRMPSLISAVAMEAYTKGKLGGLQCKDLLPPEDRERIKDMKKNYENKIA